MNDSTDLIREMLTLQRDNNERNIRIESQLAVMSQGYSSMEKRLDKQEEVLSRLSESIMQTKQLSGAIDNINSTLTKQGDVLKNLEKRIGKLEQAPAATVYETVKKIFWLAVPVFVTAAAGIVCYKIGLK